MKKADNYTELQQPIQTRLCFSPETLELEKHTQYQANQLLYKTYLKKSNCAQDDHTHQIQMKQKPNRFDTEFF